MFCVFVLCSVVVSRVFSASYFQEIWEKFDSDYYEDNGYYFNENENENGVINDKYNYYNNELNDNDEIVGGNAVTHGKYPSIVWLGNCGGTILSKRWILTAAHCNNNNARVKVIAGENHRFSNEGTEQEKWVKSFCVFVFVYVCVLIYGVYLKHKQTN